MGGEGPRRKLLERTQGYSVRLAQGAIDGAGFRNPHLGAADQEGNVGGISITVADETGGIFRRVNGRLEDETARSGITQRIDGLDMDTAAPLATCQPNKSGVCYEPAILKLDHISTGEREAELFGQLF